MSDLITSSRYRSLGYFTFLSLLGCSTVPDGTGAIRKPIADAELRIQICVPSKRVYFSDLVLDELQNHPLFTKYSPEQLARAPNTVRRITNSDDPRAIKTYSISFGEVLFQGMFSDISGMSPVQDSTVGHQPVYEQGYAYPAKEYVAIHVRLPASEIGPEGKVTYWFKLPKTIPNQGFTAWQSPVSMEPDRSEDSAGNKLWWRLTHGGDLTIYPVGAESPKMRVSLQRRLSGHSDPATDTLPALTTARMKYKTATSDRQFVNEFVPKTNEVIPDCS